MGDRPDSDLERLFQPEARAALDALQEKLRAGEKPTEEESAVGMKAFFEEYKIERQLYNELMDACAQINPPPEPLAKAMLRIILFRISGRTLDF